MPRQRTLFARRDAQPRTFTAPDDVLLPIVRKDLSGGMNDRLEDSILTETQSTLLYNVDIGTPGARIKRPGLTLVEDLGALAITGMYGYDPQGNTANLLVTEGTNLKRWTGSGSFSTVKNDFTTSLPSTIIKAFKTGVGEVALVFNGTDNVFEMTPAYAMNDLGNTNTSPRKTTVATYYRNRVWTLYQDILDYSTAAPSDYSAAFDRTTQNYRIPVGSERALIGTRDFGLIIVGKDQIWGLNPSTVPAATDKPEKLSEYGCASGKTFVQVGDDYYYLAFDGVRGLRRTEQDKLQYGQSYPLSYPLKSEYESLNWAQITKACAVYWDGKYLISVPTNNSSTNNRVWVYYPATQGWMVVTGWNVAAWATFKVNGQERLYAGESTANGLVYRAWSGTSDNGTAITYQEETRAEDMGQPLVKKYGGNLKVVAKNSGDYDITVHAAFDNGEFTEIGTLNVLTGGVTFPATFPVSFQRGNVARESFPLDSYGPWYQVILKFTNSDTTSDEGDITIYEHSIATYGDEYQPED